MTTALSKTVSNCKTKTRTSSGYEYMLAITLQSNDGQKDTTKVRELRKVVLHEKMEKRLSLQTTALCETKSRWCRIMFEEKGGKLLVVCVCCCANVLCGRVLMRCQGDALGVDANFVEARKCKRCVDVDD
jgi:hypothetical protein